VLRAACSSVVPRGERAAWVDGSGRLAGELWDERVLLVRPSGSVSALVCAEELLRCGGFALVVLAGAGAAAGGEAIRLGRAARAGGSAFVLLGENAAVAHMRVRTRIRPDDYRWREGPFGEPVAVTSSRVEVEVASLGWSRRVLLELGFSEHRTRLAPEPRLVDRRGAVPLVRWRRAGKGDRTGYARPDERRLHGPAGDTPAARGVA
jgi:hypothetical protein